MQFSKITSRKLKQATNNADDGVGEAKTERMPPYSKSKLAFDISGPQGPFWKSSAIS
jgi:hypothetical protein